jgi:SAM-dependent methyltransferase
MDASEIRAKFGDDYTATEHTFVLGIDTRITTAIAERFRGHHVLETCTGAGFTTIALARVSDHVTTVEIARDHIEQAQQNIERAGLQKKVTFIQGDSLSKPVLSKTKGITAAFLDPDWAVSGPDHIYKFRHSNTRPPADELLREILTRTKNVALILSPYIDKTELQGLPPHERQSIYLGDEHVLYCLYFGSLASNQSQSELRR